METQGYPPALGHLLLLDLAWEALLESVLFSESYGYLSGNGPVLGSLRSWRPCLCTWQMHPTGEWRHLTRPCLQGKHLQPQANWPLPGSCFMVCRRQWDSLIKQLCTWPPGRASQGCVSTVFRISEVGMSCVVTSPSGPRGCHLQLLPCNRLHPSLALQGTLASAILTDFS